MKHEEVEVWFLLEGWEGGSNLWPLSRNSGSEGPREVQESSFKRCQGGRGSWRLRVEQTWKNGGLEVPAGCSYQCHSASVVYSERTGTPSALTPGTHECAWIRVNAGDENRGRGDPGAAQAQALRPTSHRA